MSFFRGVLSTKQAVSQKEFYRYSGSHKARNSIAQQLVAQLGFSHLLAEYFDGWNVIQVIRQQSVSQKAGL